LRAGIRSGLEYEPQVAGEVESELTRPVPMKLMTSPGGVAECLEILCGRELHETPLNLPAHVRTMSFGPLLFT
jgi:hypothetical protein